MLPANTELYTPLPGPTCLRCTDQSRSEFVSTSLKSVMPGIRGSSGTVDRNLSSAALNASGFPVMSRRDLGRVLNKRGPRIAKEFSRVFLTDGGDVEDVLGIIHSR